MNKDINLDTLNVSAVKLTSQIESQLAKGILTSNLITDIKKLSKLAIELEKINLEMAEQGGKEYIQNLLEKECGLMDILGNTLGKNNDK